MIPYFISCMKNIILKELTWLHQNAKRLKTPSLGYASLKMKRDINVVKGT